MSSFPQFCMRYIQTDAKAMDRCNESNSLGNAESPFEKIRIYVVERTRAQIP